MLLLKSFKQYKNHFKAWFWVRIGFHRYFPVLGTSSISSFDQYTFQMDVQISLSQDSLWSKVNGLKSPKVQWTASGTFECPVLNWTAITTELNGQDNDGPYRQSVELN